MGTGLIPVLKRPLPNVTTDKMKTSALEKHYEMLDTIAWEIGCTPISEQMAVYAEEDDAWFNPRKGMISATSLLAYLQHNPGYVADQDEVMDDLRKVKQILSVAAKEQVPFTYVVC